MTNAGQVHLWLRAECKKNEKRTALTPSAVSLLIKEGFKITVEKSVHRIFDDEEYAQIEGVDIVPEGSWYQDAPSDAIIFGLKELPETFAEFPQNILATLSNVNPQDQIKEFPHTHIFFAHAFKQQKGWKELLNKFIAAQGNILDLEFLNDEKGRRVAAFGYWAGFAGAAVGLMAWIHRQLNGNNQQLQPISFYPNVDTLISDMKDQLQKINASTGKRPSFMVMGALGRCGTGACDFVSQMGIKDLVKWDMNETKKGGPFSEILDQDIFINCIYLSKPIPPFLTKDMLSGNQKKLSVIVDVSCDATNPHNPIPVYDICTTFDQPLVPVLVDGKEVGVDVVSIDHLPTLLPREASESFSKDLLPSIIELKQGKSDDGQYKARVWREAHQLFKKKCQESQQ